MNDIRAELIKLAKSMGIDKIGITKDGENTVVVALFPYFAANEKGNIAMYARGRDYHKINNEKMRFLSDFLLKKGAKKCEIYVDNAKKDDRKMANLAGLGFYGQNNLLICDEFGSYFTIGQIVVDLDFEIEIDLPDSRTCENCESCVNACPTGALNGGTFTKELCISDITQRKGILNEFETEQVKKVGSVWGCDICQLACSFNKNLPTTALAELLENRVAMLAMPDVAGLSEEEFQKKYDLYSFTWRGVDVLKRNLEIVENITKM